MVEKYKIYDRRNDSRIYVLLIQLHPKYWVVGDGMWKWGEGGYST